jgi:hypothetical protein
MKDNDYGKHYLEDRQGNIPSSIKFSPSVDTTPKFTSQKDIGDTTVAQTLGEGNVKKFAKSIDDNKLTDASNALGQTGGGAALRPKWLRKLKQLASVLPG